MDVIGQICHHDSMALGSRYRLIDCELDSNRVQVAMSLQGHTLKSGCELDVIRQCSESAGLDPSRSRTGLASWTRGDQNRALVSGLQVLQGPHSLPI